MFSDQLELEDGQVTMGLMNSLLPPEKVAEIKDIANSVLEKYSGISDPMELMLKIAKDQKNKNR